MAWAGSAVAQEAAFPDFSSEPLQDESYVADPAESFVVEHSNQVAAAPPRPTSPPAQRCREYSSAENGPSERGLACPQADGSWRIVSGPEDLRQPREREERVRETYPDYPDYTNDEPESREVIRPMRRYRLDWDAWSSNRRSGAYRPYGYRNE